MMCYIVLLISGNRHCRGVKSFGVDIRRDSKSFKTACWPSSLHWNTWPRCFV